MTKIVYLHVGLPKTASSTLQNSFMNSPDVLRDMNIRYLRAGTGDFHDYGHHILVMGLLGERGRHIYAGLTPERVNAAWDEAMTEIAQGVESYYFISSELFSMELTETEDLERLRDAFSDYELRVVMVLRDPGDFLNSVYAQRVRDGYDGTLLDYADQIWPLLNWKHMVNRWRDVFGQRNVLTMRFENLNRDQLADDMLRRVFGWDYTEQRLPNAQNNASVPHMAIEFFQQLNRSTLPLETKAELRNTVHRYLTSHPNGLPRPNFLSQEMRDKLQAYCEWPDPVKDDS